MLRNLYFFSPRVDRSHRSGQPAARTLYTLRLYEQLDTSKNIQNSYHQFYVLLTVQLDIIV